MGGSEMRLENKIGLVGVFIVVLVVLSVAPAWLFGTGAVVIFFAMYLWSSETHWSLFIYKLRVKHHQRQMTLPEVDFTLSFLPKSYRIEAISGGKPPPLYQRLKK